MLKDLFRLKKIVKENEAMKEVFGDRDIDEFVDLNEHLKKKKNELDKLDAHIEKTKIKHLTLISEIEKRKKDMLVIEEVLLMELLSDELLPVQTTYYFIGLIRPNNKLRPERQTLTFETTLYRRFV